MAIITGFYALGTGISNTGSFQECTTYTRPAVSFTGASLSGLTQSLSQITAPTGPTGGIIYKGAIFDALTGGNCLMHWDWLSPGAVSTNFPATSINLRFNSYLQQALNLASIGGEGSTGALIDKGAQIGTLNGAPLVAGIRLGIASGGSLIAHSGTGVLLSSADVQNALTTASLSVQGAITAPTLTATNLTATVLSAPTLTSTTLTATNLTATILSAPTLTSTTLSATTLSSGTLSATAATVTNAVGIGGITAGNISDTLTAHAGGGATSATGCTGFINRFSVVATASDSGILPAPTSAPVGAILWVTNAAASNALALFPDSGASINALSADAAFTMAAGKSAILVRTATAKWHAILTA